MNLQNILSEIEKVDGDALARIEHMSRRSIFQNLLKKTVMGAAPVALAGVLNKTYAQSSTVADVLNFALTLEYLEAEYYNMSLATPGLIPSAARPYYEQIAKHENSHVALLKSALGSAAVPKPTFDFTAGGKFADVFSNVQTNYAVAQAFEDTGVRAYKGQATNLMSAPAILTVALQIHSVEARHAARIRYLRGNKGWITLAEETGLPQAIYSGEENVTQGGVNLVTATGYSNIAVSEAFDEPLSKEAVLAIATPFIKSLNR
ncbi:ferritin-like domain-containing protein [Spirosoma luteolum]